ncbi:hypothetical protein LI6934_14070 [Bacillus licheniformis LMG 6934]|nr:hypothetical protein LI6934_14070 [Bacillus licheniformis LMG 6934]
MQTQKEKSRRHSLPCGYHFLGRDTFCASCF